MAYSGSTVPSFTVGNFYFGCELSGEGAANVTTTCDVTLTGYKVLSNEPVATQSFTFTPSEPVDTMQGMPLVTLNSDLQLPLETLVVAVSTPGVSMLIVNVVGKHLGYYPLRIMCHLALNVARYHGHTEYDGFDVLDFTKS